MENLAPPLALSIDIYHDIQQGISLREAIKNHCDRENNEFSRIVVKWYYQRTQNIECHKLILKSGSQYRKVLIGLLEQGLQGIPIIELLRIYIDEVKLACLDQLEAECRILPYRALIPLLLFQFPSILILFLGPIIWQFALEV